MGGAVYTLSCARTIPNVHREAMIICMMAWLRSGFLLMLLVSGKFSKAIWVHMASLSHKESHIHSLYVMGFVFLWFFAHIY